MLGPNTNSEADCKWVVEWAGCELSLLRIGRNCALENQFFFFNYSPFVSASGRHIFPCCLELTSLLVPFLGPDPGVNTHGWTGVTLSFCSLRLPGFSSGPASLKSWLLFGNAVGSSLKPLTRRQARLVCKYLLLWRSSLFLSGSLLPAVHRDSP